MATTTLNGWHVNRHGGRRSDGWRVVFCGGEEEARAKYAREHSRMRQLHQVGLGAESENPMVMA